MNEEVHIVCPVCGEPMCWNEELMRSDIGAADKEEDDAIISIYTCRTCGTYMEIYEPSPIEKETDYKEYWENEEQQHH